MGSRRKWDDERWIARRRPRSRRPMMRCPAQPLLPLKPLWRGGPDAPPSRGRADYPGGGNVHPGWEEDYVQRRPRPRWRWRVIRRRRDDDAPPPQE
jgi:hypothetical protein